MKTNLTFSIDVDVAIELDRLGINKSQCVEELLRAYLEKPIDADADIGKQIAEAKARLVALEKTQEAEAKLSDITDEERAFIIGIPEKIKRGADRSAIFRSYCSQFKKTALRQGYFWKIVEKTLEGNEIRPT